MGRIRTVELTGTVDGVNRDFATGFPLTAVSWAHADGAQRLQSQLNGFTINLATGVLTFNDPPENTAYKPWAEVEDTTPVPALGGISSTISTGETRAQIRIGETWIRKFTAYDETGARLDLTSGTGWLHIYDRLGPNATKLVSIATPSEMAWDSDQTIGAGVRGDITVNISGAKTIAAAAATVPLEAKRTYPMMGAVLIGGVRHTFTAIAADILPENSA